MMIEHNVSIFGTLCFCTIKMGGKRMLMNYYSDYKEGMEDSYRDLYKEFNTPLRMTGYIDEGEYADYKGYGFLDRSCIFISLAKFAIEDNVNISEIKKELKEIFESNVVEKLKKELEDFEVFYSDYLAVQREYNKL